MLLHLYSLLTKLLKEEKVAKIKAKGYYRDAVRSSKTKAVKSSELKWVNIA